MSDKVHASRCLVYYRTTSWNCLWRPADDWPALENLMPRLRLFVALSLALLLAGGLSAVPRVVADDAAAKPDVTLQIMNWEQTLELVKAQKGKIVVLDAWSTSCQPCVEEFPNLVKLHKQHGQQVACMSLSCDYAGIKKKPPEFYREKVLEFLRKQEATFPNILCNVPADELFEQMDLAAIPAVYVFGRDGKLVKRFDNDQIKTESEVFTYKEITQLVNELLAK